MRCARITHNDRKLMSKLLHTLFYIALFAVLALAGWFFFVFQGRQGCQLMAVVGMAVFYIVWGIVHHILEDEFDFEVLLDYLLIAGLVVIVFLLAIKY